MELEQLINSLNANLQDVKAHLADYCYVSVEDCETILEYLDQLQIVKQNQ